MERLDLSKNKYQNAKIYKITDLRYTEQYIGSTVQPLCKRMAGHRSSYNEYKKGTGHYASVFRLFDKYGVENCIIQLIINTPCETSEELHKVEGEYIRKEECVNKQVAGRGKKQYALDSKEKAKMYYKQNFEKIQEYNKHYYKSYMEKNNEKINNYKKEWRSSKIQCIHCGLTLTRGNLSKHTKRKHPESINI